MGKMVNQLLDYNAESERPNFYDNFRRTYAGRPSQTIFADQPASATSQNQTSNVANSLPVRLTRLRRGPRWIATN
jgi:hypothetical protein